MPDPTFTTPPDAPSRASPSTFSSRTDAFLAWMVTFKSELTTAVSWFSSTAATVSTDASTTEAAKDAAIAAANAAPWVSAASYTVLDVVISPVDYQPYRAITTHSGVTTDPSLDATNWVQQFVVPEFASQAEAEAGTDNTTLMTPLRSAEAIAALSTSTQQLLATYDLASATTVDIEDFAGSGYKRVVIIGHGIKITVRQFGMFMRFKIGGTYLTTSTYGHTTQKIQTTAWGSDQYSAASLTAIRFFSGELGTQTTSALDFTLTISEPDDTATLALGKLEQQLTGDSSSAVPFLTYGYVQNSTAGAVQGVRIYSGGGTGGGVWSEGTISVYGVN